jgi:hypothetical protein
MTVCDGSPTLVQDDSDEEESRGMHPEFRQASMRQRERELEASLSETHTRSEKQKEESRAVRLVWGGPDESRWTWVLATWRIAGS